jgi:hypothetical protein
LAGTIQGRLQTVGLPAKRFEFMLAVVQPISRCQSPGTHREHSVSPGMLVDVAYPMVNPPRRTGIKSNETGCAYDIVPA